MNNDLHAKALRAARWAKANNYQVNHFPKVGNMKGDNWTIRSNGMDVNYQKRMESDEFIEYCEDRGWQDAESDGVEWTEKVVDSAVLTINNAPVKITVHNCMRGNGHEWQWSADKQGTLLIGTKPTRAEARKAAVEAARGLG